MVPSIKTLLALGLCTSLASIGCAHRQAPDHIAQRNACPARSGTEASDSIRWVRPDSPDERARLDAWCWAVGPPVHNTIETQVASGPVDSVAVLVWNGHVGGGDVRRLISDLRTGLLTAGQPVEHFVILLQEAHRAGPAVPISAPDWSAWAGRIQSHATDFDRVDVEQLAWVEGLSLFYAPSMRNGPPSDGGPAEDRGNAILSTLPLGVPTAIELPYERQRRVALLATVQAEASDGEPWSLRVVSAHLDNRAALNRVYRSFGAAQSNQVRGLLSALEPAQATVLGADLNNWYRQKDPGVVRLLQARFSSLTVHPSGGTADLPLFLPDLRLDHLFFGLPDSWGADYRLLEDRYGSDHTPLLGWVYVRGGAGEQRSVDRDFDQ